MIEQSIGNLPQAEKGYRRPVSIYLVHLSSVRKDGEPVLHREENGSRESSLDGSRYRRPTIETLTPFHTISDGKFSEVRARGLQVASWSQWKGCPPSSKGGSERR